MIKDGKLVAQVPYDANPDYLKVSMRKAKMALLDNLLNEMAHGRYWVIRFDEEWPHSRDIAWYEFNSMHGIITDRPAYKLFVTISEAPTRKLEIPEDYMVSYEDLSNARLSRTAIGEIKRRIKRKLWNSFSFLTNQK